MSDNYNPPTHTLNEEDELELLPPNDFYFAIDVANGDNYPTFNEPTLTVIIKETWNKHRYWNDEYADMTDVMVEPLGYYSLLECVYEIPGHDIDKCKQKMLTAGFVENPDILIGPFGSSP